MTEESGACGCARRFQRPCEHMIDAVLKGETDGLTLDEVERTERFIERMRNNPRREELERELRLPYVIRVVRGGVPGSGKGR